MLVAMTCHIATGPLNLLPQAAPSRLATLLLWRPCGPTWTRVRPLLTTTSKATSTSAFPVQCGGRRQCGSCTGATRRGDSLLIALCASLTPCHTHTQALSKYRTGPRFKLGSSDRDALPFSGRQGPGPGTYRAHDSFGDVPDGPGASGNKVNPANQHRRPTVCWLTCSCDCVCALPCWSRCGRPALRFQWRLACRSQRVSGLTYVVCLCVAQYCSDFKGSPCVVSKSSASSAFLSTSPIKTLGREAEGKNGECVCV